MEANRARRFAGLAVAATIVVVIALIWLLVSKTGGPPPVESFTMENVPVDSPRLEVAVDQVRGELRNGYMEWACLVKCLEPDGCHAELVLTAFYLSSGEDQQIVFAGTIDVPSGSRARLGGVQRPPRRVDSVERVEVTVDRLFQAGDPEPTPEY